MIIATDADVDGMHIRLLVLTFFLQFFPELVRTGHVYIFQTPLFRVRDKKQTIYCYTDEERLAAIQKIGAKAEITRFKGLGEISPAEIKGFIGKDIRLDQVHLRKDDVVMGCSASIWATTLPNVSIWWSTIWWWRRTPLSTINHWPEATVTRYRAVIRFRVTAFLFPLFL